MEVKVRKSGTEATVTIRGSIRIDVARRLRNELLEAIQGTTRLVIDMSGVDYTDSSGLATLLDCMKRVEKAKGTMVLRDVQQQVMELFKLGQLDQIFDIESSKGNAASA